MKTITQFKSINSFTTNRLIAEKIQQSDFDKIRLMHTNTLVMNTLGGLRNEAETQENLNWNLKQWEDNGFGTWVFYLKETGEWIGRAGLRRVEVGGREEIEIGYALMPSFWQQGLATEMTQACLEIAFEVVRLDHVVCFTLTTNKASQRVMEKTGFVYERDIIHADLPHVLYRMKNPRKVIITPYNEKWSHEKLVKAMTANLNVHMTYFAQYLPQVELIRIPGYTIVNSGLADDTFNYVLDADFSAAEANEKISVVTHYFLQKNMPFSWWISPHDQPNHLEKYLINENYENTENNTAMYFDLNAWEGQFFAPAELKIIQAKDEKTLQDFALVLANDETAFKTYFSWIASILTDDDPIEYYVGYVNDKPVVRGLSCYFAQVAGLHWLSTAPNERKKGYGAAMQQFRLKRAKELGYHVAVLQASSEGYPLYKRLGYKECGIYKEFKLKK